MKGGLEGADALFDDQLVDGDVHGFAQFFEVLFPLGGPVVGVAAAEEVVPDVLGLPEVYFEGHLVDGFGDEERGGEGAAAEGSPAAEASRRTMARFMRWPAVKPRSWVSRGIWSASARLRRVSISAGSKAVGLDGAAEAGVDGEAGGGGEGGRRGHAGLGEEVEEGGVVFVDLAEGVLHLGDGLVEDGVEDAVLLVGEEGGEGVGSFAEEAVDEADDFGEIGAADGGRRSRWRRCGRPRLRRGPGRCSA